jgi:gas vesicle protein
VNNPQITLTSQIFKNRRNLRNLRINFKNQHNPKEVTMSDRDEFGAFLVGFIVGGLTGAVVALLFAPQSGEETRALIKDKSIELRDKAQQTAEETLARAEALASETRARADELARQMRERGSEMYTSAKERGQAVYEDVRERGKSAMESIRKPKKSEGETPA